MSSRSATVMKQLRSAWNQNFAPPASPMRALKCWMDASWLDVLASDGNTHPRAFPES